PRSFLKRLSPPPTILPSDSDLPEFTRRHFKRHGHLDVQSQIDHALADDTSDRLRHRRQYRHTPIVPRRKALLPSVPSSQPLDRPLAARLTTLPPVLVPSIPTVPLQYRIAAPSLPSFARRDPINLLAIVSSKVKAVIKRLQAVFDHKDQLLDIPHDHRLALQRIGDKLEWILDNITENSTSWTRSQQQNIDWFCKEFGKIKFGGLGQNFERVVRALVELERSRYAPLAEDDFESDDPGLHTHPAPSQAHTRPASPTATLQAYPEIQWIYAGVEYGLLEDAIRASANSLGITNQAYVDWTISVTRDITRREVVNVYNVLGNKIYDRDIS
ncbi:hypothetical protein BD309DRAFT_1029742, partial [Dichomitus squalens]